MRSVGWAFAQDFWSRHRLVLALGAGYLLALVLLVNAFPAGTFDPRLIANLTIPLWFGGAFLLALFSHGDQADLVPRDSGYPRRLLSLPLATAALVGWPLALGAATVVLFWLVLGGLILRSAGLPVPLLWLAVFLTALLAWLQALTWFPFPLPFLRILVTVLVLSGMTTGALLGYSYEVSPALLLVLSACLIPPGYLLAVAGMARARRGDGPIWSWPLLRSRALISRPGTPARRPFASASAALCWLEWRRCGFGLPLLVSMVTVPQLGLLYFFHTIPGQTEALVVTIILYPLLFATAAGTSLGNCHPDAFKELPMPAFSAARPVLSTEIIAAKLRVALRIILVTWPLVLVAVLAALPVSRARTILFFWTHQAGELPGGKGPVLLLLLALGLPALTWKFVVSQLWIGLTGRRWIVITMSLLLPVGLVALALFSAWVYANPEVRARLLAAVPWVVGLGLLLKLGAGVLVARALWHSGLVAPCALLRFAVSWLVGAAGLFGLAFWLVPPDVYSPLVVACAAVLVGLPLVRLGLAPLALDWNRHR